MIVISLKDPMVKRSPDWRHALFVNGRPHQIGCINSGGHCGLRTVDFGHRSAVILHKNKGLLLFPMTTAPETIFYPTYNPPYSPHQIGAGVSSYGHTGAVDHKESVDAESGRASTSNASVVRGPWWMLGFEKRLSLVLCT
jgi:hypothetical protein